jgi:hypothetical protein
MKSIKAANLEYEIKNLAEFKQNESKCWKSLKKFDQSNNSKKPTSKTIKAKDENGEIYQNDSDLAEAFGKNLHKTFNSIQPINIPKTNSILPNSRKEAIISHHEFRTALNSINTKSAPGLDKVTNKALKNCPHSLLKRILKIFNASIKNGHIPSKLKISKIVMIPKKDKPPDDLNSYRPISLISCIAKLLEKIINRKLQNWIAAKNILPPCQSGFRKNMSTQDHIFRLSQAIIVGFNKKEYTGTVFFDLEKAFDKASHQGILSKLKKLGLNKYLINWIKQFMTDRKFRVSINNSTSNEFTITTGVPQGSCLSPTLFSIFFSDIAKHIPKEVHVALFADDLCIWFSNKSLKRIAKTLNIAIECVNKYCQKWGLSINSTKTIHTVFTTAGYRSNYESKYKLNLRIENETIPLEPFPTFLGIQFDPKLNFQCILENIDYKSTSKINLIRRIKGLGLKNSIALCKVVFKNFIRSLVDYAFIPLSCSTQKISSDVQKLQNKVLRHIKFFPLKTRITDMHKQLKLDLANTRTKKLLDNFLQKKSSQSQLINDATLYYYNSKTPNPRFTSLFDDFYSIYIKT